MQSAFVVHQQKQQQQKKVKQRWSTLFVAVPLWVGYLSLYLYLFASYIIAWDGDEFEESYYYHNNIFQLDYC